MKTINVILGVLGATAIVGLPIWLAVEHQARLTLEEENQGLRQQVDQMAELAAENERLSNLVAKASHAQSLPDDQMRELLRLRSEVSALRQQGKVAGSSPNENPQAPASAGSAIALAESWPRSSWAFAGYTNPTASLKTALWAANKGDVKTFLRGITGEAQKIADTLFAGKSESEVSAGAMVLLSSLKGIRVTSSDARDEETVVLTTETDDEGGPQARKVLMKKVGTDWKIAGYVP